MTIRVRELDLRRPSVIACWLLALAVSPSMARSPVVLWDLTHSVRHSPVGEVGRDTNAYNVLYGYARLRDLLERDGFTVRIRENGRLSSATLRDVDALFIGLMSFEALELSDTETKAILDFVRRGGGLHMLVDHTNTYNNAVRANRILDAFGIRARHDTINDPDAAKASWVESRDVARHPVTEGLSGVVTLSGCSLDTKDGVVFTSRKAYSEPGDDQADRFEPLDPTQVPVRGPLAVAAAIDYGEGRVFVLADANAYGSVWLFVRDNERLALNAFRWLADVDLKRKEPPSERVRILVHEPDKQRFRSGSLDDGFYEFYLDFARVAEVEAHLDTRLEGDWDGIVLFEDALLTKKQIAWLKDFVRAGGALWTLGREDDNTSDLLPSLGADLSFVGPPRVSTNKRRAVAGPEQYAAGVLNLPAISECLVTGTEPVVYREDTGPGSGRVYVASRKIGDGLLIVTPFSALFTTRHLGFDTSDPPMGQQRVRRLQENIIREMADHCRAAQQRKESL